MRQAGPGSTSWRRLRFWAWPERSLDGAGMQTHAKPSHDTLGELVQAKRRLVQTYLLQEAQDLGTHLVPTTWTRSLRDECRQATLSQRRLGGVEHRSRKAETGRGSGDGVPLELNTAQHLVFDLDEVARIEEGVPAEDGIGDGRRLGVQRTGGAKRSSLVVGGMNNSHKIPPQRHERRSNYVRLSRSSEPGRRHLPGILLRWCTIHPRTSPREAYKSGRMSFT